MLKHLCQQATRLLPARETSEERRHPIMPDFTISSDGISKLLKNLKPNKAAGPDKIRPLVLRELREEIAPILEAIFTKSLDTGKLPDDWKSANVVPIYKKGSKHLPVNYRPVSLTCICSKLMEHIVVSQIAKHLDRHCILDPNQHGFRKGLSCETQLIQFVQELHTNTAQGKQVDAILMDFSKAFDKVAHHRLLYKLGKYGIEAKTKNWIKDFLTNRSQQVVLDGMASSNVPVTSGVPQGSVLGPILFLIFINDISDGITSNIRLFADDTIIYPNIKNTEDAEKLQTDLHTLERWSREWQMEFHPSKCNTTHYSVKIPHPQRLHAVQHHTWSSCFCEIPWGHTHHRPPVQPSYWQHQKECQRDPPIPKEESKDQLFWGQNTGLSELCPTQAGICSLSLGPLQ